MTYKFNNVYLNNTAVIAGPVERKGPLQKYFDKSYSDYYMMENNFFDASIRLEMDSIKKVLKKEKISISNINLFIGGDITNEIATSNYVASKLGIPYIGIYSACASFIEGVLLGATLIDTNKISNALITTSSHNNLAEKTFRYPTEYGGPKRSSATFTVTGGVSTIISNKKTNIKVTSCTIGRCIDSNISDVYNMGAVMAIGAADTIYKHLNDLNRNPNYYDLILTGDLGRVGKDILKDYMNEEYNIILNNLDDSACIIYDIEKQSVYSGGSGPVCLPLVSFSYIYSLMKEKKLKRVLLVGTGALMNTEAVNMKKTIPTISHAISLEVTSDN